MTWIRKMIAMLATLAALTCTATVTAQFAMLGVIWSKGLLEPEKRVRYAGVLFGLDPFDLMPGADSPGAQQGAPTRETELSSRVQATPAIAERQQALGRGTDDIRGVVMGLRVKRERQEMSRKAFESFLQQLESDNAADALRQIRETLEALPPRLAKDILYNMLTDPRERAESDVMADALAVIRKMPADKIGKVVQEFKTDAERDVLHEILVEIGQLKGQGARWTGAQR
jgi:hypothetical protein